MQRTAIILACFFICASCFAQQYPFVHYTPKDGLINSRVKKAYQDSKGRIYFLTYGGLSVYDGARFRNYTTHNGLPIDIVNDVLEVGDDSLLVATNAAKINLLVKGRLETFKTENNLNPLINQFYRHTDGFIYLSSDFGLYSLEKNKIHELNISGVRKNADQLNLGNITGIGNYLVLTTNDMSFNLGIYLYDIKNNRICDSLPRLPAYLVGKDQQDRIWISSGHQLLIVDNMQLKNGKLSLTGPDKGYSQASNYSTINIAFQSNQAWFVYRTKEFRNSELHCINEDGNLFRVSLPGQTAFSYIKYLFIDRENNIWLCNDGEGVFKIVRSPMQIIEQPFGKPGIGQTANVFYSNGITWYTTISKKIFSKSTTQTRSFTSNQQSSPVIFYYDGKKILSNDDRNIYEASLPDQTNIINFRKIISLHDTDLFVGKLIVSKDGAIITTQLSGIGIWLNKKLIYHKPIEKRENIQEIFIDENNRLWTVRRILGIDVYNIHTDDHLNYMQPAFHIPPNQLIDAVRSCVIDKKGLIWIGTRDRGLAVYVLKDNALEKLFHFHTGNGLSDNFVTSLSCDSLNNIIAGTQMGLDLITYNSNNSYKIENLTRNSNLFAYIQKTWADAEHAYGLTGSGVVLQIKATATEKTGPAPQLLLEELKINAKNISHEQTIFNHNENNISFLVAAPSYIDEKQVRYSYLLQGSGNDRWSDTSVSNSTINLTNLSSGKYLLKVRAFFPSNVYSPSELSYSFVITPPWWRTWWFRTGLGFLVIGLLIIGFRFYYRRKLEKQMAVLERQQAIEKERTRIATDMHDDLGAGLSRIKFLSETIGIKKQQLEPIEEDVNKIREYSHEMIDKMGEIVWALNEKNDTLSDLLSYTRSYTVEYLFQNGIACKTEIPDNLPSFFVSGEFRRNVFLTIKEALHNIVKHSRATEVKLIIHVNHHLSIKLLDNGIGIDKNNIRVFSNGLTNMESRVKEIGGKIDITNSNGTLINLSIPLNL